MFFEEPFPKTAAWANANLSEAEAAELQEYRDDVGYHLGFATDAQTEASAATRPRQWALSHDGSAVYVIGFEPLNLVRFGDVAIREAATALDLGLQYTNRALGVGVPKDEVRWSRGPKDSPLRAGLRKLGSPEASALVNVIDALFRSIGLDLLHGYRHWVTHRGAPRLRIERAIAEGIPLTDEIRKEADERKKQWLIET